MSSIKLESSDGELFDVEPDILKHSGLLRPFTKTEIESESPSEPIPVPNVNGATLKKVLQWCTHHRDDPEIGNSSTIDRDRLMTGWDAEFFRVKKDVLFEIILAANYLDIKGLLDDSCLIVANIIKGKSPEEIKKIFKIKNDFAPVE